jgi:hypothetical protein
MNCDWEDSIVKKKVLAFFLRGCNLVPIAQSKSFHPLRRRKYNYFYIKENYKLF